MSILMRGNFKRTKLAGRRNQRVSTVFKLKRSQATLDFVDVDVEVDTRVFCKSTRTDIEADRLGRWLRITHSKFLQNGSSTH